MTSKSGAEQVAREASATATVSQSGCHGCSAVRKTSVFLKRLGLFLASAPHWGCDISVLVVTTACLRSASEWLAFVYPTDYSPARVIVII